jgi:predicted phosphodiesterase
MKTLIIPDIHGKSVWKQMIEIESPDRIVFLGDYFDSFDIPGLDQIHNFKEVIEYKKSEQSEVILLIGNHDYHYYPEIGYNGTSGYQGGLAPNISQVVNENRDHLQMAYTMDHFLFTNAGVSEHFMGEMFGEYGYNIDDIDLTLNELFKYKPLLFDFSPYDFSGLGDHVKQTPIWIRPTALLKANKESELKSKYIQIVGHTHRKHIDFEGKSSGGRYYFVDTLDDSQEYLTIVDGQIKLNNL